MATVPVQLDGTPNIVSAGKSPMKLARSPQIAIAVPVGDRHLHAVFTCDKNEGGCGAKWSSGSTKYPLLVPARWAISFTQLQQPLNTGYLLLVEGSRLSGEARQIMTKEAIRQGVKYILYWDDDVLPPTYALTYLHDWMERHPEAGAISAVYTTRQRPQELLIYTKQGCGAARDIPLGPDAEPVQITGAGAGFMLARVDAIKDVMAKLQAENGGQEVPVWADEAERREDGEDGPKGIYFWGHDVRFCKILTEWGWPVYAHGGVLCGHYDLETNKAWNVPEDLPGFKVKHNINTASYWDQVYGREGANTWRQYPEMFTKVMEFISTDPSDVPDVVVELGCGVGVLGSLLTAKCKVSGYTGYDISPAAVEIAKARFLDARVLDVRELSYREMAEADTVVATELMEHLDEPIFHHVLDRISACPAVKTFIFTVPDNCMGPDTVREHTALFNEDLVRERLHPYLTTTNEDVMPPQWENLRIEKAGDGAHLVCVLTR